MDNAEYEQRVAENVRAAIMATVGSVHRASIEAGIPYATLDRKLRAVSSFTVAELRRLAAVTKRRTRDFLPVDARRAS